MSEKRVLKNALISVFHKDGLAPIVKKLNELGIVIYSTGGTQSFIEEQGINVKRVEDLTTYPSILGGRVKTLHPNIFGGILSRRELESDKEQLEQYNISEAINKHKGNRTKAAEELGIGRPSTYASIISVIANRGYADIVNKRFFPTTQVISLKRRT